MVGRHNHGNFFPGTAALHALLPAEDDLLLPDHKFGLASVELGAVAEQTDVLHDHLVPTSKNHGEGYMVCL